jgi:hypothetical protein
VHSVLDEAGHCLGAVLLSVVILPFQKSSNVLNKMLVESVFKTLPMHLYSFVIIIMKRNAVCFSSLEQLWFHDVCSQYKF